MPMMVMLGVLPKWSGDHDHLLLLPTELLLTEMVLENVSLRIYPLISYDLLILCHLLVE